MTRPIVTDDMANTGAEWLASSSDDIAHARGTLIRAEYKVKRVHARLFLEAEGSIEMRKAIATCHPEYEAACDVHAQAEAKWEELKDKRNKLELMMEVWRTQSSNERGIMRAVR